METNIKYINQICVDLGGTGGHILNVRGENEICTLLGGTGGHSLEINALNEICTIQGVTAGHSLVLNALNAIAGVTKATNLEAWKYIQSGSVLNPPFNSDLLLNHYERSGIDILEKSEINAKIIPSCGQVTPTDYLIRTMANFAGSDASGYVEIKFYYDNTTNINRLFGTSDTSAKLNYAMFYVGSKKMVLALRDGANFNNVVSTNNTFTTAGWYTVRFESTGSAYKITVNGVEQELTATTGSNDGKWLNLVTLRDNVTIGALIYSSSHLFSASTFGVAYVDYNGANKWYLSGKGLYEYDTIGSLHLTWVGTNHKTYDINASTYFLENNFEVWTKSGAADEQVPVISDTAQLTSAGYALESYNTFATGAKIINMPDCIIDFNYADSTPAQLAVMDRSNETYQSAISRASSDYDAVNVYRYHIANLADPRIYNEFFNIGHAGKFYAKITTELSEGNYYIKSVTGFLLYTTDHTGADQYKIMQYCKSDVFAI